MLAHVNQGRVCSENQQRFIWGEVEIGTLQGKKVMLVGAGNIGLYVAQRLSCLGMHVVGVQREPKDSEHLRATYDLGSFCDHLGDADFVVNILPDTTETRNLFDRNLFKSMKPSALFMNIGRGSAVVDGDLVEAIGSHEIAGAVLDVFRHEPLPPSHQFWVTPNITITPHIAGPTNPERMVEAFLSNFDRFVSNRPLSGRVDLSRGY
ncbi:Glyoxylate/hydroxypyruvate reductase A [compost metagenome]